MAEKRSPWFYIFVGCGVVLLGGIIAIGVVAFMAVRWGQNFRDELEDPQVRAQKAHEFLAADTLPAGYHAQVHLNAPFGLMRMVILTDGEETSEPGSLDGEHMFMYMEFPGWDKDWKRFANGGEPNFDNLGEMNVSIDRRERLGTGDLVVDNMEIFYAVSRGEVSGDGFHSDDGVFSLMFVRCPEGDKRQRMVIWSGPASESEEIPVAGTTGDPLRISEMMGNFRLCG